MEDPADILAEFFDDDEIIAEDLGDIRPDNGIDLNTENDQDDAEGETDKIGGKYDHIHFASYYALDNQAHGLSEALLPRTGNQKFLVRIELAINKIFNAVYLHK